MSEDLPDSLIVQMQNEPNITVSVQAVSIAQLPEPNLDISDNFTDLVQFWMQYGTD